MGTTYNQILCHFHDKNGQEATTFWTLADQPDAVPAALVTLGEKIQDCSRAALVAVQWQTTHLRTAVPSSAMYSSRRDRAHMTGTVGPSEYAHYDLIAPRDDIFLADGVTLDLANVRVSAMVAAMMAVLGNVEGTHLTRIKRGRRQWAGPAGGV